jgi:hypothetical protein
MSSLDDAVFFDADTFKEVLTANKDCQSATLYVSSVGLAKVNFKVDDFDSIYVLVESKSSTLKLTFAKPTLET